MSVRQRAEPSAVARSAEEAAYATDCERLGLTALAEAHRRQAVLLSGARA